MKDYEDTGDRSAVFTASRPVKHPKQPLTRITGGGGGGDWGVAGNVWRKGGNYHFSVQNSDKLYLSDYLHDGTSCN